MKKFILATLILTTFCAKAQMPGYMGKRFVTGIETSVGPTFPLFGWNSSYLDSKILLSLYPGAFFDYAVTRGATIGLKYSTTQYNFTQGYYFAPTSDPKIWNVSPDVLNQIGAQFNSGKMQFNSHTIAFSWKRFNSNLIAPLGRYFNIDLGVSILNAKDVDGKIIRSDGTAKKGTYLQKIYPYLSFGYGSHRIFFNRLLLNTNINFGWYPGMFLNGSSSYFSDYGYDQGTPPEELVKAKIKALASNSVFIRVTIGLAVIY